MYSCIRKFPTYLVTLSFIAMLIQISATIASGANLKAIKKRGALKCGITLAPRMMDMQKSYCKALAVAIIGDAQKVEYLPIDGQSVTPFLASDGVDVAIASIASANKVELGVRSVGVFYYDGHSYLVPKALGVKSAKELDGASVCVLKGNRAQKNNYLFFEAKGMSFKPYYFKSYKDLREGYIKGKCDTIVGEALLLAALRSDLKKPDSHLLLPEVISKVPVGINVQKSDDDLAEAAKAVLQLLINSEELGVNSSNVEKLEKSREPTMREFFSSQNKNKYLVKIGLQERWMAKVLKETGNYGEIFERTIGLKTPVGRTRGLDALWPQGGMHYQEPMRN